MSERADSKRRVPIPAAKAGWGIEKAPYPTSLAHIKARYELCVGCGICEIECSMFHFGKINRQLARIKIG